MKRMADWSAARLANAQSIWRAARKMPGLRVPEVPPWAVHAAYKCYVAVDRKALAPGWDRDRIMAGINALGVPCYSGSCSEIYLEKAFDATPWRPAERLPVARELGETSLMFLVHPTLDSTHMDQTIAALATVMEEATC